MFYIHCMPFADKTDWMSSAFDHDQEWMFSLSLCWAAQLEAELALENHRGFMQSLGCFSTSLTDHKKVLYTCNVLSLHSRNIFGGQMLSITTSSQAPRCASWKAYKLRSSQTSKLTKWQIYNWQINKLINWQAENLQAIRLTDEKKIWWQDEKMTWWNGPNVTKSSWQ